MCAALKTHVSKLTSEHNTSLHSQSDASACHWPVRASMQTDLCEAKMFQDDTQWRGREEKRERETVRELLAPAADASSPPNCTVIQIFIWSWDVDRSIEQNESSLWSSCQSRLGPESVYLTARDIPTISLSNPRHLEVNYFTNLSKWHAIVPSVSISSPLFLNLRGRGSRRRVQGGM